MEIHGISSLTLWCLGVALLQIGLWRPISWVDVREVRKSVVQLKTSNLQYHDLTYRLIWGNFGGSDHDSRQAPLQDKVYRKVVCELEAIRAHNGVAV